jgi:TPR repeat protein
MEAFPVLERPPNRCTLSARLYSVIKKKRCVTSAIYYRVGDFPGILENLMKRAFLPVLCSVALIANVAYAADAISDKEMADRYFQAAQSGDNDAQFYLGALYSSGVGRPRSDDEAFQWFSRAAEQGHSHAMLVLSGLYAIGRGTSKDNVNAYKWAYIISVGTRVEEFRNGARQLMGLLETKMTADELSQARSEASRWHAVPSQARLAAPTSDVKRDSPLPQPLPTAGAPAANAATSSNSPAPRSGKKDDMDGLMDKVPSELRKRFGF